MTRTIPVEPFNGMNQQARTDLVLILHSPTRNTVYTDGKCNKRQLSIMVKPTTTIIPQATYQLSSLNRHLITTYYPLLTTRPWNFVLPACLPLHSPAITSSTHYSSATLHTPPSKSPSVSPWREWPLKVSIGKSAGIFLPIAPARLLQGLHPSWAASYLPRRQCVAE